MKQAGILLPLSSLPSPYGIGTMGKEAYKFIDFLKDSNQTIWQLLPIHQTSYGDSPYQSPSAFAGNPYFIDIDALIEQGLLTKKEAADQPPTTEYVDYAHVYYARYPLLRLAFSRFDAAKYPDYEDFCARHAFWLDDYATFMAIKGTYDFRGRNTWALADRRKDTMPADKEIDQNERNFWKFLQYMFFTQWEQMHTYAKERGIALVGDMPIYVADDSADVWANPTMFCLNAKGMTKTVAGVPPDYFSETGQLWGNPLYDWKAMKQDNYNWWYERLRVAFSLFDIVRIDHFRGFCNYWSIPAGETTAINGKWKNGPGAEMFTTLEQRFGYRLPLIAEDLGDLDAKVHKMLDKLGYPGMKVLQFAFDSEDSDYLPPHYTENCVVYTGTHDNRTTQGWLLDRGYDPRVRFERAVPAYRGAKDLDRLIRYAMESCADYCIIPMQDYLGLDDVARINTPGTLGDNWKWRLDKHYDKAAIKNRICKLTEAGSRNQE